MGKLFYQLSGAFAEFERDCIRERVKAGLRNARAKGKRLGRPCVSVDAARIGHLRVQGRSVREIARRSEAVRRYSRRIVHKPLRIGDRSALQPQQISDGLKLS
jgi:DNA invertase Pin-like site-specific DNA recombinase